MKDFENTPLTDSEIFIAMLIGLVTGVTFPTLLMFLLKLWIR